MHTHTHTHTHMSALECLFSSLKIFFLSLCYVLVMYSSSNILSSSFIVSLQPLKLKADWSWFFFFLKMDYMLISKSE